MPSYYNILRAQLITDIRAVLGPTAVVCFGRPRREIKTYPHAVVKTRRQRPKEGPRRIGEGFEFAIVVKLGMPTPYPEDGGEVAAMASFDDLTMILAPNSLTEVPDNPPLYAGYGNPREVIEMEYVESEDPNLWIGYKLKFQTRTTVYQ